MSGSFDPNSHDAVFSRILQKLDEQNRSAADTRTDFLRILGEIRDEVKKTNGRVSRLESWRAEIKGKTAMLAGVTSVAVGLAGWAVERFLK